MTGMGHDNQDTAEGMESQQMSAVNLMESRYSANLC
jgi:hypothetical protein